MYKQVVLLLSSILARYDKLLNMITIIVGFEKFHFLYCNVNLLILTSEIICIALPLLHFFSGYWLPDTIAHFFSFVPGRALPSGLCRRQRREEGEKRAREARVPSP
jgi:hypothetical protein